MKPGRKKRNVRAPERRGTKCRAAVRAPETGETGSSLVKSFIGLNSQDGCGQSGRLAEPKAQQQAASKLQRGFAARDWVVSALHLMC